MNQEMFVKFAVAVTAFAVIGCGDNAKNFSSETDATEADAQLAEKSKPDQPPVTPAKYRQQHLSLHVASGTIAVAHNYPIKKGDVVSKDQVITSIVTNGCHAFFAIPLSLFNSIWRDVSEADRFKTTKSNGKELGPDITQCFSLQTGGGHCSVTGLTDKTAPAESVIFVNASDAVAPFIKLRDFALQQELCKEQQPINKKK